MGKSVLIDFAKPDSLICVLITTDCLTMGVHFPDVRNVIHWGLHDSIIQYWQQLGREGLNVQPSFSYLYAHSRSIQHRNDCIVDLYHACQKPVLNVLDVMFHLTRKYYL